MEVLIDAHDYISEFLKAPESIVPAVVNVLTQLVSYWTFYLLLNICLYVVAVIFLRQTSKSEHFQTTRRVLFVTAHPDDECMFFGPLIIRLAQRKPNNVYVLCLSKGDFENKGHLRKQELYDSCRVLGVPAENIFLCCNPHRKDGPMYDWKTDLTADVVQTYVETLDIDTIVTFDKDGVSGHKNHSAVYKALTYLNLHQQLTTNCSVFTLDSVGLLRKYSGLMDFALSLVFSSDFFILSPLEFFILKNAMKKHKSQWVWFRKLYMCFSRYAFMNTYTELERIQVD